MRPPSNAAGIPKRERLLFTGNWKSGKSFAALDIALKHQKFGSDAVFYWVDTDKTCNELIGYPPFEDLSNVMYEEPDDWESLQDTTKRFLKKIRTGDWLVVDMISPTYEWAQDHACIMVYGEDKGVLMAKAIARQMGDKKLDSAAKVNMGQVLLDVVPWKIVTTAYNKWAQSLISQPGHLIIISGQKEIYRNEKGPMVEQFGGVGIKPDAQNYTGHLVNDVLWFRAAKAGEPPRINTIGIGARGGRPVLKGEAIKSFAIDVLVKQYGWKSGKEKS